MTNTTDPQRPEVDDPRVLALATARQQLAHRNPFNAVCPPWDGLSEQEQRLSLLDARSYLHAAMNAGLVPDATAAVSSSGRAALLHKTADKAAALLREAADIADEVVPPDLPRSDRDQGRVDAAADIRKWADFVEVEAELRRVAAETQDSAPSDWIDGHPQLEAIAAAVWERCEHHDSGLIVDDPRNIAVAALAAVLAAPADGPRRVAAEEQPAETQDGERLAKNLRAARRRVQSTLVANADRLSTPFTDEPGKNPWDTFVRPAMRELKSAVDAACEALADTVRPVVVEQPDTQEAP